MSSRISILGSGNSTSVPWLHCVANREKRCAVCQDCLDNPNTSKNVRNNVSALVSYAHPDGRTRHILIDVGKTFRSTVIRQFNALGVKKVDAIILTHPHFDAVGGLDDLRDLSPDASIPVYLSEVCFRKVAASFEYLVKTAPIAGLFIAQLDWRVVRPFEPFECEGLIVTPLPVEHGEPGPMLAFEFCQTVSSVPAASASAAPGAVNDTQERGGAASASSSASSPSSAGDRVVYISDIAALPLDVRAYLKAGPRIDVAVIDALSYRSYPTHFSIKQAIACALDLNAKRSLFVGLNHRIDYYSENEKLQKFVAEKTRALGIEMELAYDGWCQAINLDSPSSSAAIVEELKTAHEAASNDWLDGKITVSTTADKLQRDMIRKTTEEAQAETDAAAKEGNGRPRGPSMTAKEGAFSSLPSPEPVLSASPFLAGAERRRPLRFSPANAEFEAFAAAQHEKGSFAGWVRPADLPSLRPLVTGVAGSASSDATGAAALSAPVVLQTWPAGLGRPPAVTYLDSELPEWEEGSSVSLSADHPPIQRLTQGPAEAKEAGSGTGTATGLRS